MDEIKTRQQLIERYRQILCDPDHQFSKEEAARLSGVFLTDVTEAYCGSSVRIMIVGQETKKWNGVFENYQIDVDFTQFIMRPLAAYSEWVTRAPSTHKFLQFRRSVEKRLGGAAGSVAWGNVFAVSHKNASPVGCGSFPKIQALSSALLRAQVEILKPHGILFTAGWRYDKYLKACFASNLHDSCVLEKKALWRFKVGSIRCFRTSHPRYVAHNTHRETAVSDLIENVCS